MAKKLTKAQIAKNPTKAINSGKMKMKKQEVPFGGIGRAAARVVGKAIVNATTGKTAARKYAESKARSDASKASVKAALKTAKKSKPLAEPKSNVRVIKNKTAPKNDLSSRGAKLTSRSRKERAQDYRFEKGLKELDATQERFYGGLKGPKENGLRGPGKSNARKRAAIKKESTRKLPIKINSSKPKRQTTPPF